MLITRAEPLAKERAAYPFQIQAKSWEAKRHDTRVDKLTQRWSDGELQAEEL